jgi:phytoene dehydrogenase-like protein
MPSTTPIVIIGAGLSGLCAAITAHKAGHSVLVLEADLAVGGRIQTDVVEGFTLDRGFQVLLTAYPQVQAMLDLPALQLGRFLPGAISHFNGRFHRIDDVFRNPGQALPAVLSPVGTLADKIRVALFRLACLAQDPIQLGYALGPNNEEIQQLVLPNANETASQYLQRFGFSPAFMRRFLTPFFGGVFLDSTLGLPAPYLRFLFRCFAVGNVALPAGGMQAIPKQLAAQLPAGAVRLQSVVTGITKQSVTLATGQVIDASRVIVATDPSTTARLLGLDIATTTADTWRQTHTLYYATPTSPVSVPLLVLNGDGEGPINTLSVLSKAQPTYAPVGQHVVSVSVLTPYDDPLALKTAVEAQLTTWYGVKALANWRHLKTYTIPQAQPKQGWLETLHPVADRLGVTLCGDYLTTPFNPSIQGAMMSGVLAG